MAGVSISQAQAAFLGEIFLDTGGVSKKEGQKLDPIQDALSKYIVTFLKKAKENLQKTGSNTTGNLDNSLSFDVVRTSNGYRVDFKALEYFKFVDKGVRGAGSSRKNNTSPYKFKKINPSKDHVTAIEKWIIRNRLTARAKDLYGREGRERKAIYPTKGRRDLAYIIARSIKRDGLYETGFWSDAFDETFQNFGKDMSVVLGQTITVNLERMKEDLASFKKQGPGRGITI